MRRNLSIAFSVVIASLLMMLTMSAFADDTPVVLNQDNATVELTTTGYTYSGYEKKPTAIVTYNDNVVLVKDTDYTVSYENNINAGTGKVIVTGIGNYDGELTADFTINPKSISPSVTLNIKNTKYSGKAIKPTATVKYGDTTLTSDMYSVSYKNNVQPGIGTVTVKGTKNYKFTVSRNFSIAPGKVENLKQSDSSTTSAKITWKKFSNATETRIYLYDSSKKEYKYIATVPAKTNSYTIKNLTSGSVNSVRVRAVKREADDRKLYGDYTYVKAVAKPKKTKLTSVTKKDTTLTAKWEKTKCTGYLLFYTTDPNFKKNVKSVKIEKSSTTSYKIKKLNKKSKYYCKVQPYTTSPKTKKNYYASKSTALSTYYSSVYASYSSYYVNNPNRTNNLRIASKAIDGTIIQPGETFSFNKTVGPRTTQKGYKPAPIFAGSDKVEDGVGGGICQVASTMFNCALYANVKITERSQHSQRVGYVPLGRDAAIYWGSQDFKWTNNTKYPIMIKMTVADGQITCKFVTCYDVKPKKVKLNVSQSGNHFTLKRYVDNKCNYTTYSNY